MAKADRIVRYFPSLYWTGGETVLREVVGALAEPLEHADTLLFRIQRAHRLKVAEHTSDLLRLAAVLQLTPFHFEDILAGADLPYADKLERMRERVVRVARIHLTGLGTPWAVLEAAAVFLEATLVPTRPGEPPIRQLDGEGFSHVATIEFARLADKPRERLYLHENPLRRRKVEPVARWPLDLWTITNANVEPAPVTLSIEGVGERTLRPAVFCPDTGQGVVFNGIVPAGQTLLIDREGGARLDGVPVDDWLIYHEGGLYDFATAGTATAAVEEGREGTPFDGDGAGRAPAYRRRPVPVARVGASRWYFGVTIGTYDATTFDYAAFETPAEPVGVWDRDAAFDTCVFDYPPCAIAGMAWDERTLCAFKLLLPSRIPPRTPPAADAPPAANVNYVGRVGSSLPRFKAAGVRAYVDAARDAWIVGESVVRDAAATDGEGVTYHATRLRSARSDMFVDSEPAS